MQLSSFQNSSGSGLWRREKRIWTNAGTHTWYIPQGVTKVFAFVIGAGGGGYAYNEMGGSKVYQGGKGGGYAHGVISGLTPGNTLTVTVGLGGKGYSRNHSGSGTAGGNSSLGNYLTGSGGGAGTVLTSDPGDQRGQGGGASTSGVSEAYTASGGGGGRWINTSNQYTYDSNALGQHGGGSSGSPFGNGDGPMQSQGSSVVTGGAGWAYGQTWRGEIGHSTSNDKSRMFKMAFPGGGSHFNVTGDCVNGNQTDSPSGVEGVSTIGGCGLTAKGGKSYGQESGYHHTTSNAGGVMNSYALGVMDGEDANPRWWFPWEIDGGGGGAFQTNEGSGIQSHTINGGKGGSGAGGGGVLVGMYNSMATIIGGNGGFGGGGGAASSYGRTHLNDRPHICHGGQGGIGGGGGAAWCHKSYSGNPNGTDNNRVAFGGHGGNGCVCIYW